ncbi:hypothetical protein GDO86_011422 [Hymenochirus boettgeri]|uniref:Uncharacterized protein n=1 Tax=Hymenochirus boettgeri TaxID=247094 RepID=A0A8T2JBP7_9PIPI|nr:hypothetical protein GDO86_011422 [Hymenochirus boettgeri]
MSKSVCNESSEITGHFVEPNTVISKKQKWGLVVTGVVGGTLVALYAVVTPFVAPALRKVCLPYVPATTTQVENVLKILQFRSGPVVDIGSGDGRIVIAAAKKASKLWAMS